MQAIFYQAKEKTLFGKLISWWTTGKFSHVELVFSDGTKFSSSHRDHGVRFKEFELKSENWAIVDLPMTEAQEARTRGLAQTFVGKKYDYKGVLGFVYSPLSADGNRWYCSEICAYLLNIEKVVATPPKISPSDLYYVLNTLYGPSHDS